VIPVGQYYTGKATVLFFASDHDVSDPTADSTFSNVRVYERESISAAAPKPVDDRYVVNEDSPTVMLRVLANDDDAGGGALTIAGVSRGSAGGTIYVAADQTIRYRPVANFFGAETFTYTVATAGGHSTATVTVNVRPVNDAPIAVADAFTVIANSRSNVFGVLGNDSAAPDTGEILTIIGVGKGSAGGTVAVSGGRIVYSPRAGFSGTETFTYTVGDGTPGSNATATVAVKVVRPAALDFDELRIDSYGGRQDFSGEALVQNGGLTLRLVGNTWKKIDLPYTVTSDTVLEFDFSSSAHGELHGIGLDTNTSITPSRTFRIYGTQDWGIGDFDGYTASSGKRHYVIPVGRYYTGQAANVFFVNDHDVNVPNAESVFSNVRVYEARSISAASSPTSAVHAAALWQQLVGELAAGAGSSPGDLDRAVEQLATWLVYDAPHNHPEAAARELDWPASSSLPSTETLSATDELAGIHSAPASRDLFGDWMLAVDQILAALARG
jgi:hypothetical protein